MDSEQQLKRDIKKLNKMKQAKVSFQLKNTGMQLDEDRHGEKRSVSNQFLVGSDDRPSVRRSGASSLFLPPSTERTQSIIAQNQSKTLWRTRALVNFKPPNARTVQLIPKTHRGESIRTEHKTSKEFKLYYNIYCKIHI